MGRKSSSFFQSDRPESGGANKDEQLEKSGILDREKEKLASSRDEKGLPKDEQRRRAEEQKRPAPQELDREERSDDRDPGHS